MSQLFAIRNGIHCRINGIDCRMRRTNCPAPRHQRFGLLATSLLFLENIRIPSCQRPRLNFRVDPMYFVCPIRPRRTSSRSVIFLFSCRTTSLAPRLEHVPVALCSSFLILPSLLIPVKSIDGAMRFLVQFWMTTYLLICRVRFTGFLGLLAVMS